MLGALGALGAFLLTQSSCTTYTRVQGAAAPQLPSKSLFFGEGHVRLLGFRKINSACFFFFFSLSYLYMQLDKRAWQPASSEQQTGPVLQQFADK